MLCYEFFCTFAARFFKKINRQQVIPDVTERETTATNNK